MRCVFALMQIKATGVNINLLGLRIFGNKRGANMILIIVMLLVLVGSFALLAGVVYFSDDIIDPSSTS